MHRVGHAGRDRRIDRLRTDRRRHRNLHPTRTDDAINGNRQAGHSLVRDAGKGNSHGQRGDLVGADNGCRGLRERVAIGPVHTECLSRLADAAQVEPLGHSDEAGID